MNIGDVYNETSLRQQLHLSGWSSAEEKLLHDAAEQSKADGTPLRTVFAAVAKATGRQPNSVRNHYYLKMKNEAACGRGHSGAFVPFTDEEVENLMRTVLTAVANGESVRSCTLRMGNGDNRAMLRYQNKYRAILKKNPELVARVLKKLEDEGVYISDPYTKRRERAEASDRPGSLVQGSMGAHSHEQHGDMVRSVAYAVESLAKIDEFSAEMLFRSLGVLASKAAGTETKTQALLNTQSTVEYEQSVNSVSVNDEMRNGTSRDMEAEHEKHITALARLYRMLKDLVSLNYDFLNRSGINKMSHLSEYINELSERVSDCEQLMSEMRDDIGGLIG